MRPRKTLLRKPRQRDLTERTLVRLVFARVETTRGTASRLWLATLACYAATVAARGQTLSRIQIETADAPTVAEQMAHSGFDVLQGTTTEGAFDVIVSDAELETLRRDGFDPRIIAVGGPFRQKQAHRQARGIDERKGYPDLAEIIAEMEAAASEFPSVCRMVDLTAIYGTPATVEGRHILAVKISDNVSQDEDEPTVLLVSAHHAREVVTPVITLHTIEQLTTQYDTDPAIADLVDQYEIWIAPVWNPDGYQYVFSTDNMWRKNRRAHLLGVGVDLNRNYPLGWGSGCSGSIFPWSNTYKGPNPASEAETQTMLAFSNDRNFAKAVDYHSAGRETVSGYACLSHPFSSFLKSMAAAVSVAAGYGGSNRPPKADGEHYQTELGLYGALAFLLETQTSFQPSYTDAQVEAAMVWPATVSLLAQPIPLSGHVSDALSGAPLKARVFLKSVDFQNGEVNATRERFGRYHAFLPQGTFAIEFASDGYLTQRHEVSITADTAQTLDVALEAAPIALEVAPIRTVPVCGMGALSLLLCAGGMAVTRVVAGRHGRRHTPRPNLTISTDGGPGVRARSEQYC